MLKRIIIANIDFKHCSELLHLFIEYFEFTIHDIVKHLAGSFFRPVGMREAHQTTKILADSYVTGHRAGPHDLLHSLFSSISHFWASIFI